MAIDKSGEWWTSPQAEDIEPYLRAYVESVGSYRIDDYRTVRCVCGCECFRAKRVGDVTRRECTACKGCSFVCRSSEDWEEAAEDGIEDYECVECKGLEANLGVGFSRYAEWLL
jgi:hypothetical protein